MFTVTKTLINSAENFSETLLGFWLEKPSAEYILNVSEVIIAGWVLPQERTEAQILIEGNGLTETFLCDKLRQDVTRKFFGENNKIIKCGFWFKWSKIGLFKIYFLVKNQKMLVAEIAVESEIILDSSSNITRAIQTWQNFIYNRINKISKDDVENLQNLNKDLVSKNIYGKPKLYGEIARASQYSGFLDNERKFVTSFLQQVTSDDFCADLVESVLTNSFCSIANPFGEGKATCNQSFHILKNVTVLRFITPSGETFFIFQWVTSADTLYFPARNLVFIHHHVPSEMVSQFIISLCLKFSDVINYTVKADQNEFGGILTSFHRPSHFYYDICLGLYFLYKRDLIEKIPAIYLYKGEDYFSTKKLFNLPCSEYIETPSLINQKSQEHGLFYLHIGANGLEHRHRIGHEELGNLILTRATEFVDSETANETKIAKDCYPLLWFGITGQKRSWLEQVEGGAKIITELAKLYPKIGVVFDGWTCPENPSKIDITESARDRIVVDQIMELLPQQIKTFSVVGVTTVKKLAFATIIDAFIANKSTGSIHVAGFARKPGIGHMNHGLNTDFYLHYKTHTVPTDLVTDIPSSDPKLSHPQYTSYSINPDVILNMVKEILT